VDDGPAVERQTDFPRCVVLERRIAELQARVAQLERLLDQALRSNKRQAAPFFQGNAQARCEETGWKVRSRLVFHHR